VKDKIGETEIIVIVLEMAINMNDVNSLLTLNWIVVMGLVE
jgi:hypothetical protein